MLQTVTLAVMARRQTTLFPEDAHHKSERNISEEAITTTTAN